MQMKHACHQLNPQKHTHNTYTALPIILPCSALESTLLYLHIHNTTGNKRGRCLSDTGHVVLSGTDERERWLGFTHPSMTRSERGAGLSHTGHTHRAFLDHRRDKTVVNPPNCWDERSHTGARLGVKFRGLHTLGSVRPFIWCTCLTEELNTIIWEVKPHMYTLCAALQRLHIPDTTLAFHFQGFI